jgi:serine/threonine-protein kinase
MLTQLGGIIEKLSFFFENNHVMIEVVVDLSQPFAPAEGQSIPSHLMLTMSDAASFPQSAREALPPDLSGRTLGDYRLLHRLGRGGMGQVYLAEQLSLKRQVAIKLLRFDLSDTGTALKRFQMEAETIARLNHPNIVQIYQLAEADGIRFMVLEYVQGRNLRHYLERKGPPDLPICLSIIRQVACALQKAHEAGIVHRDIKPENILLTRRVEVKVADFGLSRLCAPQQPALHLTQSGVTVGTPLYMSPEQVQGQTVDHRSDIYSFGVTCYHLLAGEPPFQGNTAFDVALKHVKEEPPPLTAFRPDVPIELAAMVHKMMAKRPEERYQSMRDILRDLGRIREKMTSSASEMSRPRLNSSDGSIPPLVAVRIENASPSANHQTPATNPLPVTRPRWLWYATVATLGLLMGGVGAVLHSSTMNRLVTTSGETSGVVATSQFHYPGPIVPRREQYLLGIINKRSSKTDDVVLATIELVSLYVQQGRYEEALNQLDLLERESQRGGALKLSEKGGALKGDKGWGGTRSVLIIVRLAKAAVEAFRPDADAATRSKKLFIETLEFAAVPPKNPKFDRWDRGLIVVQPLLVRCPALGELCHAALDRIALANGTVTLTPPILEQLRQPPRLSRGTD